MGLSTQSTFASIRQPKRANPAAEARVTAALASVAPASEADSAQRYTRDLARSHYENFSVVSWLLPRELRQDFCNVYAFCRVADDMADELGTAERASQSLAALRDSTRACYDGDRSTRLFAALGETIERHQIPIDPFLRLSMHLSRISVWTDMGLLSSWLITAVAARTL